MLVNYQNENIDVRTIGKFTVKQYQKEYLIFAIPKDNQKDYITIAEINNNKLLPVLNEEKVLVIETYNKLKTNI